MGEEMKASVRDIFVEFSTKFEGCVPWLYADVKNLITVAIGNLVDASPQPTPWRPAISLPFVRPDGLLASPEDITRAWLAVKGDPKAARYGHRYAETIPGNDLRLTAAGISEVVLMRLDANESYLRNRFSDFEDWPADAQLATHSMAWACGPAFRFPKLEAALKARDFDGAALECHMNEAGNPGLVPRNIANKVLYSNASRVMAYGLDPELHWPERLSDDLPTGQRGEREEETGSGGTIHPLRYDGSDPDDAA